MSMKRLHIVPEKPYLKLKGPHKPADLYGVTPDFSLSRGPESCSRIPHSAHTSMRVRVHDGPESLETDSFDASQTMLETDSYTAI